MELQDGDAMDVSADYFSTLSQSQSQLALVYTQRHIERGFDTYQHDIPVELELPRTYVQRSRIYLWTPAALALALFDAV
ncbi:hypothetical protein AC578_10711 [Pseudocercospora eumusae]|uniref:Uncharacterized protein n=1 Tax=Pseudocercospora eumusae TaxID=321146 RepID=A0A139H4F2_9PEZI|nr:hypothetical protein AC578_10711 [Pseudocercospora eumusae]KXS97325.1 hypothetical protein AC578_10711 [Pseudocercospora eumusae]KXS97326.1 hypothetical protein AC578_10711 [Pseudocercospora eumusae]